MPVKGAFSLLAIVVAEPDFDVPSLLEAGLVGDEVDAPPVAFLPYKVPWGPRQHLMALQVYNFHPAQRERCPCRLRRHSSPRGCSLTQAVIEHRYARSAKQRRALADDTVDCRFGIWSRDQRGVELETRETARW